MSVWNLFARILFVMMLVFSLSGELLAEPLTEEGSTTSPPAKEADSVTAPERSIPQLAEIKVLGVVEEVPAVGQSTLSEDVLGALPSGNGTLNEQLRILPGIQYGEGENSSLTGGEILPAKISISGGRTYDNNFQVDGLGNNSLIDPAFSQVTNVENLPGHPQELFLSARLFERITVYRSNVSARDGGFTGGVVDAKTRMPAKEFGGDLYFRTTRSEWTEFHVNPDDQYDFANSVSEDQQPKFRKYEGGFSVDIPLNETMGVLVSYNRLYSSIPLSLLGEKKTQRRQNENFFLEYAWEPSPDTTLTLTGIHAPYEGDYFLKNTKDSDFTLEGGGTSFGGSLEKITSFGKLEINAGYRTTRNARQAPRDWFSWYTTDQSKDWGNIIGKTVSWEGGYGDVKNILSTWEGNAHLAADPIESLGLIHNLSTGLGFDHSAAEYDRSETSTRYTLSRLDSNVVCLEGQLDCADGEQFMIRKVVNEQDQTDAVIHSYFVYAEDEMLWWRLSFRPGVHISYNDYLENIDLGHRFLLTFDALGQGSTILSAGVNRYYGQTFLAHKLAAGKKPYTTWSRSNTLDAENHPQEWYETIRTNINATRVSSLDSPYVDEWTAGVDQELYGGRLLLQYLERRGRDLLALTTYPKDANNYVYSEWNDNGRSFHQEASLAWERWWGRDYLSFNLTWQNSTATNDSYWNLFEEDAAAERVIYQGDVVYRWELPREDFNRPWVGNLTWVKTLPLGFTFTNVTKFRDGYIGVDQSKRGDADFPLTAPDDVNYAYTRVSRPSSTFFDWKLSWEKPFVNGQVLVLNLEVYNVFDKKVLTEVTTDEYELGRQFWAGMEYFF